MTVKTAKTDTGQRLVVFLVYPDIVLLDLVGPLQVFSHAPDARAGGPGYTCLVASVAGAATLTNTVLTIPTVAVGDVVDRDIHTLVVVGGDGAIPGRKDAALVAAAKTLAGTAQRVCSVCSGALILAATGWLDGRRAVTHWDDCKMLADEFPQVQVEMDPIFIKDGPVWTSAGITAGIDMALAIVAEDLGRTSAMAVARSMVAQMVRSGGQSQFSPVLNRQAQDGAGQFDALHTWMSHNLRRNLTVDTLAEQARMSARNFARVYTRTMGLTPAKAVEAMRVEMAQDLLETTDQSLKQVADRCGFGDEDRMRRAFWRGIKVSPAEYRQNFRTTPQVAALAHQPVK
ncbi:helix-turn-helix domain-containing protein [uncultured Tateyamaria sp.]|uniref:GlxA family transcriptional regulator n=1 Tax=uncultured Tateyamaria sp. TaxID=455651 RepID=UPI00261B6E63|nr:helix-turn-helix domain-containing protein [uncultured Tateyamaria sp.]